MPGALRGRLAAVWRMPLHRISYLLVINSLLTAGIGLVFWLVVARLYPPAVVGENSAAISAMEFLAGIAELNLMSALLRFVPGAAGRARVMIGAAFGAAAVLAIAAASVFLAWVSLWAPGLSRMLGPAPMKAWFVVATVAWTIFVLASPALVAVSRAGAVPAANAAFSVAKTVLAIAGAVVLPALGIWLSWTVAATVACAVAVGYLFVRALPAFTATSPAAVFLPSRRDLARYVGPDYAGYLAWSGAITLTPLLVFNVAGAARAGVFTLAWTITLGLYAVAAAFGQSQLAVGSTDPAAVEQHYRQARRHVFAVLAFPVAVILVAAPLLLSPFGPFYAAHGGTTLRLLAASALPNAVLTVEIARARVLRRLGMVVAVLAGLCVTVLALTAILTPRLGITGAADAWLVGLSAAAAAATWWRRHTTPPQAHPRAVSLVRTVHAGMGGPAVRELLDTLGGVDGAAIKIERRLRTVSDSGVLLVRSSGVPALLKVAVTTPGVAQLAQEHRVLTALSCTGALGSWRDLLPRVLGAGEGAAGAYLLTSRLPGEPAEGDAIAATEAALNAIAPLNRLGGCQAAVGEELLARWVTTPGEALRAALSGPLRQAALAQLLTELRCDLAGRTVLLGWVHGDFHPGNLLLAHDGAVTGIIDWAQARGDDLAVLDIAHWLLTTDPHAGRRQLGRRVSDRLAATSWTPDELSRLPVGPDQLPGRTILLLAWLRHAANNLTKSTRYARSPVWIRGNVDPVLRAATR